MTDQKVNTPNTNQPMSNTAQDQEQPNQNTCQACSPESPQDTVIRLQTYLDCMAEDREVYAHLLEKRASALADANIARARQVRAYYEREDALKRVTVQATRNLNLWCSNEDIVGAIHEVSSRLAEAEEITGAIVRAIDELKASAGADPTHKELTDLINTIYSAIIYKKKNQENRHVQGA